jgi:peptidyl-prolyl cis-trans isomerase SurA
MIELKGEKAKLKHILLRPKPSMATIQNTGKKADSVYALLRDTLKFERAALLYSSDEKTKYNGGKYINPYTNSSKFEVQMIEPTILHTIKNLQPGQITEPILT